MINFRFHLISLIAVFLALAVGVVMGYAVLGQPTVDTLQGRVDTVEARADEIRAENDRLRAEQSRLESALVGLDDFAATNRLAGTNVLAVGVRGIEEASVNEAVRLARSAGSTVPGIVWLEGKWGLTSDEDAAELAEIVGTSDTSRAAVRAAATQALATRLAGGPVSGRTDLLTALDDAGFVTVTEVDETAFDPSRFDGRSTRFLLAGGNGAQLPMERAVLPLARDLVTAGREVVVADEWKEADQGPERGAELGVIRDDADLSEQVATIDNLDTSDGPVVVVLVLGEVGRGTIGHYGFGAGAEEAMPAWWAV